jgi:CheY-like chemotaxis protein
VARTRYFAPLNPAEITVRNKEGATMFTVLLVDDNAYIRKAIRSVFEEECEDLICGEAENGRDAVQKAAEQNPDVVILDLSMPVMNGLDAARILHGMMPSVPLYMLTTHCSPQAKAAAELAGITATFSKTEDLSLLLDRVCSALNDVNSN